jgi:hypothetical protein
MHDGHRCPPCPNLRHYARRVHAFPLADARVGGKICAGEPDARLLQSRGGPWHRYMACTDDVDGVGQHCCSVDLSAYHNAPEVSRLFAELTAAVAAHHRRVHAVKVVAPAEQLSAFPYCSECGSPEGEEIRHLLRQGASVDQIATTPSGTPLACCRVRALGAFVQSDAPQPTARR